MHPKYEVPIIPHNLRREETIIQIAEALSYLADVSEDIFKRINNRIGQNKQQIEAISTRVQTASAKVDKLSGAKKATQVFSSCKYPAENINRQYKSIFDEGDNDNRVLPIKKFAYDYKSSQNERESVDEQALQFYYVKVKAKNGKWENGQRLGEVPHDIETVNDLLLFNTGKNPYRGGSVDKNISYSNAGKREDDPIEIGAAPFSISGGAPLAGVRNQRETYFYAPHLGQVPSIDVPLDLPDLPGIADDLRYHLKEGQEMVIAPSVTTPLSSLSIPDLPEIEDIQEPQKPKEITHPKQEVPVLVTSTTYVEKQPTEETQNSTPQILAAQPDSLPEPASLSITKLLKVEAKVQKPKEVPVDNGRAGLMEAIRQAGGSKNLRSKSDSSGRMDPNIEPAPTGDLMADLHAKLSMRRKGISGNKENQSVMDKVSAMIPPPPTKSDLSESNEDDDWTD